jgi:hypothetical protein
VKLKEILSAILLASATAAATPALAESPAECQAMFRAADADGDGILTSDEIAAADNVPDAFTDSESVTLSEFMTECTD